ncbi:hypothetical protein BXQ17_12650 [Polaribacter sp. BM10]|uniref:hypothetical protein n=1 Tax=Polaribacter sp. BM10 TaxID=1529069 RepID=UPI00098AE919|nr:hypothetical protein [Polaribacter sp. BM10]AQS94876.1 hypothetical protein BXQ17_12650 [Polaribacter sp. BM10]
MKKITLLVTLLVTIITTAQTSLYENPKFDEIAKDHKIIGILPFDASVKLRPKQREKMTSEEFEKLEKNEGKSIQLAMYSWFLKRKKRGDLQTTEVQDPNKTTALLRKKNITQENIKEYTLEEIAKILGVDSVISGTYKTTKPMSEGASVALGLLVGFWGTTNSATINMSVHNATDGVLLWNYNKKVRGSIGSSPDDLINKLMRKASRRLSYTKKK